MSSAMPWRVQAMNIDNAPAPNSATDAAFKIASPRFKLDLIKGDLKASRADLLNPATIVKIDIAKTQISGFLADRAPACPNRISAQRARIHIWVVIVALILMAAMMDVCELNRAVIGRVHRLCQRRHCEEQRRRNGKRSRSGGHDTIYHCARKTYTHATQAEWRVLVRFICVMGTTRRRMVHLFPTQPYRLADFGIARASS